MKCHNQQTYCVVGSQLVVMVFVWAKLNIEVCPFVFLVYLVAQ